MHTKGVFKLEITVVVLVMFIKWWTKWYDNNDKK